MRGMLLSIALSVALSVALCVALLGAFGLGLAQPALAVHPAAVHAHALVDGGVTPNEPVCPGGSSGSCG